MKSIRKKTGEEHLSRGSSECTGKKLSLMEMLNTGQHGQCAQEGLVGLF